MRGRWRGLGLVVMLLASVLAGCDRGPSGEGDWRASIDGPGEPFGSAVVLVSGDGVLDVTGDAGTRAWTHRDEQGDLRAVLIQTEATGPVRFRIRVRDLGASAPSVAILELADMEDELVQIHEEHQLRLTR
jgi:hypothetical protein